MARILPFTLTDKRKIQGYWPIETYPSYEYQPIKFQPEVKMPVAVTEKTAPWAEWLNEYMQVSTAKASSGTLEIVGMLQVPADQQPDSDKAAVVYLTTKFLALIDRIKKEGMPLTRLPEIVIGQVENGYQAQVTLTLLASV